jgi:beta-N-acetylhexosaminidase
MRTLSKLPLLLLLCVFSCGKNTDGKRVSILPPEPAVNVSAGEGDVSACTNPLAGGGIYSDTDSWAGEAARIAETLDDRRLAAQVIISGIEGRGRLTPDMRVLLGECPAGGIMLFKYNLDTDNDAIRNVVNESVTLIGSGSVPPFVATDHEGGKVNRFPAGVADLPAAASYWERARTFSPPARGVGVDTALFQIAADSYSAGKAINGLGVNLNFAPVAEPLNENNAVFLKDRSYGPDPAFVTNASAAFIGGMEASGVLCAVKHFPGSAGADPHLFVSVLNEDRAGLADLTAPFEALIRGGRARAVMVSHSVVPALDAENTASLSPAVMGGWLRGELGFNGIIICDDFSMGAAFFGGRGETALRPETAAVRSRAAGTDMVLVWPPDLRRTHREIQAALYDGRLTRERLREAAGRIIFEKIKLGMIKISEQNQ